MADKLTLRGVKRVEEYVEPADPNNRVFTIRTPRGGGDQHSLKRWWTEQGSRIPKRYVNATVFNGTIDGTAVSLAVVSNQDTRLTIRLNDAGDQLDFDHAHDVERIAVFSQDLATLHWDYIISKIPGVGPTQVVVNAF